MVRMKFAFLIISVYCSINALGIDDGVFSPQPTECSKKEGDKKPENLLKDDEIDLNLITKGTLKYNKYAMLLVCRVLDRTFFKTPPSLATLTNLEEFVEFDQSREIKESMETSVEPSSIPPTFTNLMKLSARVLREYDALISVHEDPIKKALYYILLKWLENQVQPKRKIIKITTEIFAAKKAQNYLYEIIQPKALNEFINLNDTMFKTLEGWALFDDSYLKSLLFSLQIEENGLANVTPENIPNTNIEIYEHIFAKSDVKQFKKVFLNKEPWKVLRNVERFFDDQSKVRPDIQSSTVTAPEVNEIILSKKDPVIKYVKHATILFYQALFEKFNIYLPPSRSIQELEKYSIRYESSPDLRYCAFLDLANDLINELYKSVGNFDDFLKTFTSKAYLYRLVSWYKDEIISRGPSRDCTDILDKLNHPPSNSNIKHILTELSRQENLSSIFSIPNEEIDITRLKELGKQDDEVLSTMIKFRLDELAVEYGKQKAAYEMWKHCQNNFYSDNELATYNKIKQTRLKILRFGWPTDEILNTNVQAYENLLNTMDDRKFKEIFGNDKAQMLETVKTALAKASSIDQASKDSTTNSEIDLTTVEINENIKNYKYTMLLYSQILTYKFFNNEHPSFDSLTRLEKYPETFSESGYEDDLCSQSISIENIGDENAQLSEALAFQRLVKLCIEILTQYDFKIDTTNEYADQAFYYNALTWLSERMGNQMITDVTKEIIRSKKARNYYLELLPDDEVINFNNLMDKFKKLSGWMEPDEINEAINFALKIGKTRGANAFLLPMHCTNIEIYERILSDVDENKFQELFQTSTLDMLRIIDYSFDVRSTQNLNSPYSEAIPDDQIYLSTMENHRETVEYMKHAFILFARSFENIFKVEFLQYSQRYELDNYPTRFEPYDELRYCSFRWWIDTIPYLMKKRLDSITLEQFTFPMRAYLVRLVIWAKYQIKKTEITYSKCQHIKIDNIENLFKSVYATHILVDVMDRNQVETILDVRDEDMNYITTLERLITLGEETDNAMNFMMKISLDELKSYDHEETITYTERLLSYGKPEPGRKSHDLEVYRHLLNAVNDESKFFKIFHMKPSDMLAKVEQELNKQDSPTSPISTNTDKMMKID